MLLKYRKKRKKQCFDIEIWETVPFFKKTFSHLKQFLDLILILSILTLISLKVENSELYRARHRYFRCKSHPFNQFSPTHCSFYDNFVFLKLCISLGSLKAAREANILNHTLKHE